MASAIPAAVVVETYMRGGVRVRTIHGRRPGLDRVPPRVHGHSRVQLESRPTKGGRESLQ